MSRVRLSSSAAALAVVVAATVWIGAQWFPLQAAPVPAPQEQAQQKLTVLSKVQPKYPADAKAKGIEGDVVLHISVNDQGDVADAYVVSGPNELRDAALQAVRQWKYDKTGAVPASTEVTISFRLEKANSAAKEKPKPRNEERPRPSVNALGVIGGVLGGVTGGVPGGVEGGVKDGVPGGLPAEPTQSQNLAPTRIRVGGNVQAANLVHKVTPMYPPDAKAARVQGVVRLKVTIGRDGRVQDIELMEGDPLLTASAIDAVWQWEYKPTLLNGEPVEVLTQVDVNYTLSY